jgi:hypothetical protein
MAGVAGAVIFVAGNSMPSINVRFEGKSRHIGRRKMSKFNIASQYLRAGPAKIVRPL